MSGSSSRVSTAPRQKPDLDEASSAVEVTTKREAAIALEGHTTFETGNRLARAEEVLQCLQFGMARDLLAGSLDRVAHLSEIVDPDVVDLAALMSEADTHVASVELSHVRAIGKRF